jgi:ABC-type phosphate transport system auxiliary subunit
MNLRALLKTGDPFIWLTGGALATSIPDDRRPAGAGRHRALGFFWPADILHLQLRDGSEALGKCKAVSCGRATVPRKSRIPGAIAGRATGHSRRGFPLDR